MCVSLVFRNKRLTVKQVDGDMAVMARHHKGAGGKITLD